MKTTKDLVKDLTPKIKDVGHRQKKIASFSWLGRAFFAFFLCLLAAFLLDFLFGWHSPIIRWAFPLATLALTSLLALRALLSLSQSDDTRTSAREIDKAYPSLQERWSTVTNLSASKESDAIKGSPELLHRVATEAASFAEGVQSRRVISNSPLRLPIVGVVLGITALVILFIKTGDVTGKLSQRFFLPWKEVTLTEIIDHTKTSTLPTGSSLTIEAEVSGKIPRRAELIIRPGNGKEDLVQEFLLQATPTIKHSLTNLESSLSYQIRSGDKVTPWQSIQLVDHPQIAQTHFQLTPPSYTKKSTIEKDLLPFRIRSVEGSKLQLTFQSDQDLAEGYLLHEDRDKTLTRIPLIKTAPRSYQFDKQLTESFTFRTVFVNEAGLENLHQARCQINIFKDLPPSIKLLPSSEDTAIDFEDTLNIEFTAKDDFGIEEAEIEVTIEKPGEEPITKTIPIDLGKDQGKANIQQAVELPLKEFELDQDSELSYSVKVRDSRSLDSPSAEKPDQGENSETSEPNDQTAQNAKDPSNTLQENPTSNEPQDLAQADSGEKENDPGSPQDGEQQEEEKQASSNKEEPGKTDSDEGKQESSSSKKDANLAQGDPKQEEQSENSQETKLGTRLLDVEGDKDGTSSSKKKQVNFEELTPIEEREHREKLTILVEDKLTAFQDHLAQALDTVSLLVENRNLADNNLSPEEQDKNKAALAHIEKATDIAEKLHKEADKTPYAFAALQLQDIAQINLKPAHTHLTTSHDLPEPLPELRSAHTLLLAAVAHSSALRRQFDNVKAAREREALLKEVKEMYLLYLEDMPVLLGGDKESPYTRNFFEMTREQAEAFQAMLNRQVLIAKKIAELLKKYPRLQSRLMNAKRNQATNIREAFAKLQQEQLDLQELTELLADPKLADTHHDKVRQHLLSRLQETAQLTLKFTDNARTWIPLEDNPEHPDIQKFLNHATELVSQSKGALAAFQKVDMESFGSLLDASIASAEKAKTLQSIIETNQVIFEQSYLAGRKEELHQISYGLEQLARDVPQWMNHEYGSFLEARQKHLHGQTRQLSADIELNAAPFLNESEVIKETHEDLQFMIESKITGVQVEMLPLFEEDDLSEILPYFWRTKTGYRESILLLDRLVYHIIDLIDKKEDEARATQPQGGEAGGELPPGEVSEEEALAQLMAMVNREQNFLKSFGIPLERPTNAQIQSDWEKPANGKKEQKGQGKPQKGKGKEKGENNEESNNQEKGKPGNREERAKERARQLAKQARLAQQRANQDARELSMTAPVEGTAAELERLAQSQTGKENWNTLPSELRDQLLQEKGQNPPKQYERAIQEYFRSIAEQKEK